MNLGADACILLSRCLANTHSGLSAVPGQSRGVRGVLAQLGQGQRTDVGCQSVRSHSP